MSSIAVIATIFDLIIVIQKEPKKNPYELGSAGAFKQSP